MVTSSQARAFANPETLARLGPSSLDELLRPYRPDIERIGLLTSGRVDTHTLERALCMAEHGLPTALVNELCVIEELGVSDNLDRLRDEVVRHGLDVTEHASCADLVVMLVRHAPDAVARLVAEQVSVARRCFQSYFALGEESPPAPTFDQSVIRALSQSLNEALIERCAGLGVQVYPVASTGGFRLMVRHGDALRREAVVDETSYDTERIAFHPQRYDVLIYTPGERELLVNVRRQRTVQTYLQHIGHHLFGNPHLFAGEGLPLRYTLGPLRVDGEASLATSDVPGLDHVALTKLVWVSNSHTGMRSTFHANNVLLGLEADGLAISSHARLSAATFRVRYRGGRESSVSITTPNKAVFGRESDIEVVQRWLRLRGFIRTRKEAIGGLTPPLLAVP